MMLTLPMAVPGTELHAGPEFREYSKEQVHEPTEGEGSDDHN